MEIEVSTKVKMSKWNLGALIVGGLVLACICTGQVGLAVVIIEAIVSIAGMITGF
jgi:hypothetical protein